MALTALGLSPGAPVLTPTLTFCGAVQAIVHAGLRPVLVDADDATLTVSADGVAKAARNGAAAMVIQHMGGYPVDGAELAAAAGIPAQNVVEDAAHGLGATVGGRPVGSFSRAGCFSFYATKNLPIGEGGAIATDDDELDEYVRTARLHGLSRDAWRRYLPGGSWRYDVAEPGLKANMTDVQAAIGVEQLVMLPRWQERRTQLAAQYDAALAGVPGLALPSRPADGRHAWHLYQVRVTGACGISRDAVIDALTDRAIGTSVHFIPVHQLSGYRRVLGPEECRSVPVTDQIAQELLSLPMYPALADADVTRVAEALRDVIGPGAVARGGLSSEGGEHGELARLSAS
jgi:dTDP-4-amino-4,6-dideoxygalactose transaminase